MQAFFTDHEISRLTGNGNYILCCPSPDRGSDYLYATRRRVLPGSRTGLGSPPARIPTPVLAWLRPPDGSPTPG
jgi:hypothetical protein